jgi:hypothetical protein
MKQAHITRQNHCVPVSYQRGFVFGPGTTLLQYLYFAPAKTELPNGPVIGRRGRTRVHLARSAGGSRVGAVSLYSVDKAGVAEIVSGLLTTEQLLAQSAELRATDLRLDGGCPIQPFATTHP